MGRDALVLGLHSVMLAARDRLQCTDHAHHGNDMTTHIHGS